ncbi:hypothetical protein CU016_0717 [Enterococcus lactis]|nr:hypothetical protein [Enterococcus lactis]
MREEGETPQIDAITNPMITVCFCPILLAIKLLNKTKIVTIKDGAVVNNSTADKEREA